MLTPEFFNQYWKWWFWLFFGTFAVVEILAVYTGVSRGTLSSTFRDWLRTQHSWMVVTLAVLFVALLAHFFLDLKR